MVTVADGGTWRFQQLSNAAMSNQLTLRTHCCRWKFNVPLLLCTTYDRDGSQGTNYGKYGGRKFQVEKENKKNVTEYREYIK